METEANTSTDEDVEEHAQQNRDSAFFERSDDDEIVRFHLYCYFCKLNPFKVVLPKRRSTYGTIKPFA